MVFLYQEGEISDWCRVNLTGEAIRPEHKDSVLAFFIDYGHRAQVKEEGLAREPIFILEADFNIPEDNHQLKTIRKEIKDLKD